jgi:ubiquinone/menaquinone biosynthesis C-methylase UbiE
MNNFTETKKDFDIDYAKRVDLFSKGQRYNNELDILIKLLYLEKGDKLLDIGCGSGNAMTYFAENVGCLTKGIEKRKEYITLAKKPQDIIVSDAESLPFEDKSFNKVVIIHVIGHIEDPVKALVEARRVIKDNGKLGIITPNKYFIFAMKPLNWLGFVKHKPDITRLRLYSCRGIEKDLLKSGWKNVRCVTFGELPKFLKSFEGCRIMDMFRERVIVTAEKK